MAVMTILIARLIFTDRRGLLTSTGDILCRAEFTAYLIRSYLLTAGWFAAVRARGFQRVLAVISESELPTSCRRLS